MDLMCGPFQPDLLLDRISKLGPAIAAFVAVSVLIANRWYVRRDLRARREVLRAMLVAHIKLDPEPVISDLIVTKVSFPERFGA